MIQQFIYTLVFSDDETSHLKSLEPHDGKMWDTPPSEIIKSLKQKIKSLLLKNQNEICAYCGLELGGTSDGQIEHIAPKARYPQFTFEGYNLVMACHYCNGFSKKGNHNTINYLEASYSNCSFKLVHPYYDDPTNHYSWVSSNIKILIQAKTEKGRYSISILKLDSPKMAEMRAKKVISDIVLNNPITPQIDDKLIESILNYKQ